jgi:hypothetical protein
MATHVCDQARRPDTRLNGNRDGAGCYLAEMATRGILRLVFAAYSS